MKRSVRRTALTLIYFPIGTITGIAQGEIGRGFPYGDDGGWSGLLNVIIVGAVAAIVFTIFWVLWEILRALISWIIGLLR
ncbi:MAG TPA: hypothetical protein DC047_17080 [Blastocatellia bacterium]|nr:hypothetical protein [Blastocatellia bacterium]